MPSNPGTKTLLSLPLEVRLAFYRTLLGNAIATISCDSSYHYVQPQDRSAQILRTCRQTAEEATPVLYRDTTFLMPRGTIYSFPYICTTIRDTVPLFQNVRLDASARVTREDWCEIWKGFYALPLQSLRVTCSMVHWLYPDRLAFHEYDGLSYDEAFDEIMAGCLMLLVKTPLNTLVDESKPGRRICFELKHVNSLKVDSRVSLVLCEAYSRVDNDSGWFRACEHTGGGPCSLADQLVS